MGTPHCGRHKVAISPGEAAASGGGSLASHEGHTFTNNPSYSWYALSFTKYTISTLPQN